MPSEDVVFNQSFYEPAFIAVFPEHIEFGGMNFYMIYRIIL
jgi:hypothetical protein